MTREKKENLKREDFNRFNTHRPKNLSTDSNLVKIYVSLWPRRTTPHTVSVDESPDPITGSPYTAGRVRFKGAIKFSKV